MNIRFFLPFLFALSAMAQTPEEIVFTVSEIPHRLVVENANHQQKRLLLALNPKATAFFVLEGEADITAFIGFITEAKAVFLDWSISAVTHGEKNINEEMLYRWLGNAIRFKKRGQWCESKGLHAVSAVLYIDPKGKAYCTFIFPEVYDPIQRKGGKQQLLLFSSAPEVEALIEALQLTTSGRREN